MNKYLLEIGVEELPSRFCQMAIDQLEAKANKLMKEYSLGYESIKVNATPRRLTLFINGLDERQPDVDLEVKGPAAKIAFDEAGNPTKPLQGFMKSQGITEKDIFKKELKGTEYIYAKIHKKGASFQEIVSDNMSDLIKSINFPKNMKWGGKAIKFARPIRWVVSILNDEVVPFEFEGITVSNVTYGHRFLGKGDIVVDHVDNYEKLLEENYVILDQDRRRDIIKYDSMKLAKSVNGELIPDEDLTEELTFIVEYPTPIMGEIKEKYLQLPKEVITTPMRDHLRFIPIYNSNGGLLPYFITIRNGNEDHKDIVINGNLKVLEARLEDAVFFYKDDISKPLEAYKSNLTGLMFHEKLGNMSDKTDRDTKLAIKIGEELQLGETTKEDLKRASELSKADLTTKLVQEFTELQGVMGSIYAENSGEPEIVAKAINEQYMPRFSGDKLPESTVGSVLAIADKLDSICGMFAVGLIPTGSQDPFALRRQAIGIINIILNKKWDISLSDLIDSSLFLYTDGLQIAFDYDVVKKEIIDFFKGRVQTILQGQEIRYDVIDAVLGNSDNILNIFTKAQDLNNFFKEDRKDVVDSFVRLENMLDKADKIAEINETLLTEKEEIELYNKSKEILPIVEKSIQLGEYEKAINDLAELSVPIQNFFENIFVLSENEDLKNNRMSLLNSIDVVIKEILDIKKLVIN
ncbi:glycyl-tRNA synthetase beta chain [Peptoniphilus asaccharolyticus DSM 20463]|uniref:Glycine--tRNA ligase beta subunit n=1 Tax=Peptoniphilus asaccharolyticus DSM 20463 TaxID=573058 RepID=A0A1W1UTS1_PEPAS|nr:glycine--tRNA ligase subunit beta [Peptoniphilus asaccharolyticus]MBL7575180.1 glycine--tRNA ligase subunit beta [Peptoniphilus asaccharolyticus]SMB84502.1 glycyl-tRNA synthetase beta chain [Peptoniphilus asaccharolyticus DSM 20463]